MSNDEITREDGIFKLESDEKQALEEGDADKVEVIDNKEKKPYKTTARFEKNASA